MAIKCKLNDKYKEALTKSKKLIKKVRTPMPLSWHPTHVQTSYKYGDLIVAPARPYRRFRRLSCCGIDEGMFGSLHELYKNKVWHKDFDVVLAWYMKYSGRTRSDSRVFITGLPVKVKRPSSYNAAFYKRVRKTLLAWGCQELTRTPYKNKNSRNYISVIVGQF